MAKAHPHQWRFPVLAVERVVDGDTIDLVLDLGFALRLKQRMRLLGIDTPEIASKDIADRERARAAREFAAAWCARQEAIVAETTRDEKYGRILGDLVGDSTRLTEELLSARLAKRYTP